VRQDGETGRFPETFLKNEAAGDRRGGGGGAIIDQLATVNLETKEVVRLD
jgi:hypothetical protein